MRIPVLLAVLAAALIATPAAAQHGVPVDGVSVLRPLPAELAAADVSAEPVRMAADGIETGLLTGVIVGMATGVTYNVLWGKECGVDSDCTLSPEYKTLVFGIAGGALGGVIGAATSFLLGWRAARPEDSGLAVMPLDTGGMRVGVTLRH